MVRIATADGAVDLALRPVMVLRVVPGAGWGRGDVVSSFAARLRQLDGPGADRPRPRQVLRATC
jgi:hypothetical protein